MGVGMSTKEDITKSFILKTFHRFEVLIISGLVILISIMILAAFCGLVIETYHLVLHGAFDSLNHKAFQSAFGMIMTLLIALEFNHTIMHANAKTGRDVIVKTVVLISILAVSRQFVIFELESISAFTLIALAFSLLSLGIVYLR
jgi:uncharacterized membrane protein (DUF373 family)